jgi:hypothetical protein
MYFSHYTRRRGHTLSTGINLLSFWGLHFQSCWILHLWSASDKTAQGTTKLQSHVIQMTRSTTCFAFALCSQEIGFLCLCTESLRLQFVFAGNIALIPLYNMNEHKLRVTRLYGLTASNLGSDFNSIKVPRVNKFPPFIPPWYLFWYMGSDFKQINVWNQNTTKLRPLHLTLLTNILSHFIALPVVQRDESYYISNLIIVNISINYFGGRVKGQQFTVPCIRGCIWKTRLIKYSHNSSSHTLFSLSE